LASAPCTAVPEARQSKALCREEADDHHQGFFVAEHQRWELEPAPEPVAAGWAALGLHGNPHLLQSGDVPPNGPRRDLERLAISSALSCRYTWSSSIRVSSRPMDKSIFAII